jgi:site-specific DNA recombinase
VPVTVTSSPDPNVAAGIYCRMSLARFGDTTKVEDQERLCRELCARLKWDVTQVYCDNNASAWQRNRKRPGWDAMLADVDAGKIAGIAIYHGDRLVRQPFDLEQLLIRAEGKGVKLASPTGTRDLSNGDDLFILRIEVAAACRSSYDTSRRKQLQYERWRREGKVRGGGRGGRAYGFTSDGTTRVKPEVKVIRELATRILAGEPTGALVRELNERGLVTTAGSTWTHQTLRKMLRRPRYAGLMPDGKSRAAWKPVLDRRTWEAVTAVLDTKTAGFGYATSARRYLLSGIAVCGACGSGLQARSEGRGKEHLTGYGCVRPGCRKVQRSVRLLDAYVTRRTVLLLSNPGNPAGTIPAVPGLAAQFAALATQRTETEAAIADPAMGGKLRLLIGRLDVIDERLAGLRELAAGDARHRLLAGHEGITGEEFAALPLAVRRALVGACFEVVVLPASARGPGFRTQDVTLTRR